MKIIVAATIGAVALFAAGCSKSNTTGTHPSSTPAAAPSTARVRSVPLSNSAVKAPTGASAEQLASLLRCVPDRPSSSASDEVNIDLGPKPKSKIFCTLDGKDYELDDWGDAKTQAQFDAFLVGLVSTFGDIYYVEGSYWAASLNLDSVDSGDARSTPTQIAEYRSAATLLQSKLGGRIVHLKG